MRHPLLHLLTSIQPISCFDVCIHVIRRHNLKTQQLIQKALIVVKNQSFKKLKTCELIRRTLL